MFGPRHLLPLAILLYPGGLQASQLFGNSGMDRQQLFAVQSAVVDDRASIRTVAPVEKAVGAATLKTARLAPQVAARPAPSFKPAKLRGKHLGTYVEEAKRQARAFAIPEQLFLALIQQESAWNRNARSHVGAIGLTQLMPGTASDLNVDPHDPVQNIKGGAKYLRAQYDRFGDWKLALAAYNAGPGAVRRYGGVPPYRETRNYVRRILGE